MASGDGDPKTQESPFGPNLNAALGDYRYLLERGYPERGSIELVGDRHRLSGEQRMMLYRGASSPSVSEKRRNKIVSEFGIPENLYIDGYNVIFTLYNFRLGRPVFVSDDGVVRDVGQAHGRVYRANLFEEVVRVLCGVLCERELPAHVYLDRPVTGSVRHSKLLTNIASETDVRLTCELVPSADEALAVHRTDCIASSDSVVIDNHRGAIVDLARLVIEQRYRAKLIDLANLP